MAKYGMFNDKYTYLDLHLMFQSALEDAENEFIYEHDVDVIQPTQLEEIYDKVAKDFYDKYGWEDEFFYDFDNLVCLGDNILCDKDCNNCPCAHPVEEFI